MDVDHSALLCQRRLYVVAALRASDGSSSLDALARHVAEREDDSSEPTAARLRHLERELHHTHLPKLAATGIIEYDSRTRTAVLTDRSAVPETLLSAVLDP